MSTAAQIGPLCDHVVVRLSPDPVALEIIDEVVAALERAGHSAMARVFLSATTRCQTDTEVLLLARCTVTVL